MVTDQRSRPVAATVSTWWEDVACGIGALWLVAGLYLDGWAHSHRPELETFFTPWHAVLYSGFAALAACLAVPVLRRRRQSPEAAPGAWVPAGYGPGLAGVALFLVGGVADMAWHEILGIEVGLEALLSPPHLCLLTGGILMLAAPMYAAWARAAAPAPGRLAGVPVLVSAFATTAVAAFFLNYVSPFADLPVASLDDPDGPVVGLGQYLVTTALVVVPVLLACVRGGRVPPGLVTVVVLAAAVPVGVFHDFRWLTAQLAAVLGGVLADAVVRMAAAVAPARVPIVAGAAIPAFVWAGHLLGLVASAGLVWSTALWSGTVVLTALAGVVLALLVTRPRPQALG